MCWIYILDILELTMKFNVIKQGSTALHLAATYGHREMFQTLRDAGAKTCRLDQKQQTVLHRATQEGHWELVEDILSPMSEEDRATLVQQIDADGNSPVLLATMAGKAGGFLREAFAMGGTFGMLTHANKHGECCIHIAARAGDAEVVAALLVPTGADINIQNKYGQTALYLTAENVNINESAVLLGSDASGEDLELLELLVERGADIDKPDSDGITPIMIATMKGNKGVVQFLKDSGASLVKHDSKDQNILHLIAKHGQHKMLKLLFDGKEEEVKSLVNQMNYMENTPLHIAASEGNVEVARELLKEDYKADVDMKNWDEQTPCHMAAASGHSDVLKLLMEKDRNAIYDKDEEDNTPLHLAAINQMHNTVEVLLRAGAPAQKRNRVDWTPLDCAAAAGCRQCCELLIDNDSEIDPVDRSKLTPLHLAAMKGHPKVVKLLLEMGANISLEDRDGNNALELAITAGSQCTVEVLLECSQWRKALKTVHTVKNAHGEAIPDTPMRMLIRRFPELAEQVFDKCINQEDGNRTAEFDFEFLDDSYSLYRCENGDKVKFKYKKAADIEDEEVDITGYDGSGTLSMENHPLMLMVKGQNKTLLRHPLSLALLRRKWRMFGRIVFYLQFIHYVLFLASLTGYTLLKLTNDTYKRSQDVSQECQPNDQTLPLLAFQLAVFITVSLGFIIEVSQITRMTSRYFRFSNFIDWLIYTLSIVFVLDICIPWETLGCKGEKVNNRNVKHNHTFFAVLAVACWFIACDHGLAQLPHLLPLRPLLRPLHPHVQPDHPHCGKVCRSLGNIHCCLWAWLPHSVHQPGK